jgi:hypothetical protein
VYNWETGRILLCDHKKVVEYDPKADKVTLELTEFKGIGPFKLVQTATHEYEMLPRYHGPPHGAKYTGNIWIANRDAQFIALVDRSSNVLCSFGTYGTAKNGLNLRWPYWAEGSRELCLIVDSGSRVFGYDFTRGSSESGRIQTRGATGSCTGTSISCSPPGEALPGSW